MRALRRKFIAGIAIAVAILIAVSLVTIVTNEALTPAEKTNQALSSSIIISLLGVAIGMIVEVYFQVTKSKPLVEVIEDQEVLKQRYEEMRRTRGVKSVQAIWAAKYVDVEAYFKTEGRDLETGSDIQVERLVNPDVIGPKYRQQFAEFIEKHPNLTVWATDVSEFECYICEYKKDDVSRIKALLVLNDTLSREPQLGVFIDPERGTELKPLAYALRSWFLRLPRQPFPGTEGADNIWEVNAPSYDHFVTSTDYPFLRQFLDKEQQLLEATIDDVAGSANGVSVVEVGSGTGRTLLNLAKKPDLLSKVTYLIGIDSSRQMILTARSKRETILSGSEAADRMFFFNLDGVKLSQYFSGGQVKTKRLRNDAGEGESLDRLDEKVFQKSTRIICSLLNTLGVMDRATRVEVIRNMVAAARPSDRLIISVLASTAFNTHAPQLYGVIRNLVGGFDATAFHHDSCEFKTDKYYSQWFDKQSLCTVLEEEGCSVLSVVSIEDSGYFVACSLSS